METLKHTEPLQNVVMSDILSILRARGTDSNCSEQRLTVGSGAAELVVRFNGEGAVGYGSTSLGAANVHGSIFEDISKVGVVIASPDGIRVLVEVPGDDSGGERVEFGPNDWEILKTRIESWPTTQQQSQAA